MRINTLREVVGEMRIVGILLVFFLAYIIIGLMAPFFRQQEISHEYKKQFDINKFYGKSDSSQRAKIISDNDEARKEKIAAINNARNRIIYTTYRFKADKAGFDFSSALIAAANRGVRVEILTDGSSLINSKEAIKYTRALANHENIQLKIYNPTKIFKPWTYMGRLHDKYIIIDNDLLFLGGRNTENRFNLSDYEGKNHDWDILIYFQNRASGDSMDQLEAYFYNIFNYKYTEEIKQIYSDLDEDDLKDIYSHLEDNYQDMEKEDKGIFQVQNYLEKTLPILNSALSYNPINITNKEPWCFYDLTQLMKGAKDSVHIHTPYFIGNGLMYEELEKINENAPTTLFLNSVLNGSNIFGNVEYFMRRNKIKNTGVRLLELQNDYPYHGKVFTIDDDLIGIGSFNGDMRSVYIDTELMMIVYGKEINEEMKRHMAQYENVASEVNEDGSVTSPPGQPLEKYTFKDKLKYNILSIIFYPIRFLL